MKDEHKLFGLPALQGRWIMLFLGFLINLCLGSVYAWSIFRKPLEAFFEASSTQSGVPFLLFLLFFSILMPLTGNFIEKLGIKKLLFLGVTLIAVGWISSSYASSIFALGITYGIITGSGVGIVYGIPLSVITKWFPDKKGLAVGLVLAGFGVSPAITAPLAKWSIEINGVLPSFAWLGIGYSVIIMICAFFLQIPQNSWTKTFDFISISSNVKTNDFNPNEMLKKPRFYILWFCFVIGALAGLMAIGISSPVAQELIQLDKSTASSLIPFFALFNGASRPLFGWICDKTSPKLAAMFSFIIIIISSLLMLQVKEGETAIFVIAFSGFWLSLGAWLAIAPTATLTFFGSSNYAKNYGIMYTAYGVGAVLGTLLSSKLKDVLGSYSFSFYPTLGLACIGFFIAWLGLGDKKNE